MNQAVFDIALEAIKPGDNDRTLFDPAALRELALSILEHGLLQPVTVRPLPDGGYQLVAGERRWRAHKLAGELLQRWQRETEPVQRDDGRYTFTVEEEAAGETVRRTYTVQRLSIRSIPCLVREDLDDEAAATLMLAENVARANLDPIDEARAYDLRMRTYGWDERACAQRAGVGLGRVANRLKLLKLRPDLQDLVRSGQLAAGYAQIMAEHFLDANRQLIAVSKLREKANPNPTWFRAVVKALMTEQAQEALWDLDEFMREPIVEEVIEALDADPPHPATTPPPVAGATLAEIAANQAKFWVEAGHAWGERGETFKRRECEAAATALSALLASLAPTVRSAPVRRPVPAAA